MRRHQELEIKLEVPVTALPLIEDAPSLRAAASNARVEHLTSVYYDTETRTLRKNGLSLRLRTDGTRHIQTIKSDGSAAAGW